MAVVGALVPSGCNLVRLLPPQQHKVAKVTAMVAAEAALFRYGVGNGHRDIAHEVFSVSEMCRYQMTIVLCKGPRYRNVVSNQKQFLQITPSYHILKTQKGVCPTQGS